MNKLGIIGAGVMGTDLAHMTSEAGFQVRIYDINHKKAVMAQEIIAARLEEYIKKERMSADEKNRILENISVAENLGNISDSDIFLEAANEDLSVKKEIFKELDNISGGGSVLASITSSISITEIAAATTKPESVIGLHFLNPARIMKLVEIVPGFCTTRETIEMAKSFLKKLKKDFIEAKDYPGFYLNRILYPMINEAAFLLYEGGAKPEVIDKAMRKGLNIPMGPLEIADMVGLDVILNIGEEMFRGYADFKYRPCPLLRKYVASGYLGKKSGRGFYIY
ncbi:MAG TPA: 3-hydroxyacyl-CoA dehydrogenase NAD-binding domain-containing protein [Spirochaetota bacterium]|nr:3-hydroxyacyl-CoA dehydrogenase NAD-binding domain-containing protein [Spirochaetota bacterium]HPF05647.1 3-hydroxyacyl-CoA dehydrogenase NAD-binding domain-containing protein [Spirochaetota bacterium]HPJ42231.1 3-hydroxyacyl-CoA dehydrogenase NAD-binding domain-containing protein [Spirochaetota bacterium]HPR36761.1 3-hydroxyacyl-CoA dehydrogenase NAD-binding domain-containing protein [Spirochaetota bacterium]